MSFFVGTVSVEEKEGVLGEWGKSQAYRGRAIPFAYEILRKALGVLYVKGGKKCMGEGKRGGLTKIERLSLK